MDESTRFARQLFLFGNGRDRPIKGVAQLAKEAGCSEKTIRRHLPGWRDEAEKLSIQSQSCPFSLELSSSALAQHREEIEFLATQVKKLRLRVKKTKSDSPNYPVYLSSYKMALDKWEKSSGITAQYDVALASLKESARANARAVAKRQYEEDETSPRRLVDKSRFDVEG